MKRILALLTAFIIVFGNASLVLAQESKPAAPAAVEKTEAETQSHDTTLWQDLVQGGVAMIFIAICSIASVYLIVDGVMRVTNRKKAVPEEHVRALQGLFRSGDYVGAYKYCKNNPSMFTNICRAALMMLGEGKNAVEEAVVSEVSNENARMQYYISYLSVIGVCTPMIGLLGTVFGMKHAFRTLNVSGVGDPSKLSGAIGEVLICTAFGLLIAIPAFFAFYWLRNRSAAVLHHAQEHIGRLFRKMPYELLSGAHIGDEELYAADPNWVQHPATTVPDEVRA